MNVTVFPQRYVTSAPWQLVERYAPQLWPGETMSLEAALARCFETDAHFVTYVVKGEPYIPRLRVGTLSMLRAAGYLIEHFVLVSDVDCPEHTEMTDERRELVRLILKDKNCVWYFTKNGIRIIRYLKTPVRSEVWRAATLDFIDEVKGWFPEDWRKDELKDWTRFYRVPNCEREIEGKTKPETQRSEVYGSCTPVDVHYEVPDEQPIAPTADLSTPEALARIAQHVDGLHPAVRGIFESALSRLRDLGVGTDRHTTLLGIARLLGGYCGSGEASYDAAEALLYSAIAGWPWEATGHFKEADYQRCCRDGLQLGMTAPLSEVDRLARHDAVEQETTLLAEYLDSLEEKRVGGPLGPRVGQINRSELGVARELYLRHQDRIRVAGTERTPLWFGDGIWIDGMSPLKLEVGHLVDEKQKALLEQFEELGEDNGTAEWKKAAKELEAESKFWRACQTSARITAIVKLALDHCTPDPWDAFNRCTEVLPFQNGALELETRQLRPLRPEDMFTFTIDYDYDADAKCPVWRKALEDALPDPVVREWLQRRDGSMLSADTSEQVVVIHHGPSGTGKSTHAHGMTKALGPFAAKLSRSVYEKPHHAGSGHPTDVWRMRGLRYAYGSELSPYLYVERLNELSGCEPISARGMNKDQTEFTPTCKHDIYMTDDPKIPKDLSDGLWRRLGIVPWVQRFRDEGAEVFSAGNDPDFAPKKRNQKIFNQITQERAGIMNWLVEGYVAWRPKKLLPLPEPIAAGVRKLAYADVWEFLESKYTQSETGKVLYSDVWEARKRWNADKPKQENGERKKPETKPAFSKALAHAGVKTGKYGHDNKTCLFGWTEDVEADADSAAADAAAEEELRKLLGGKSN